MFGGDGGVGDEVVDGAGYNTGGVCGSCVRLVIGMSKGVSMMIGMEVVNLLYNQYLRVQ